MWVAAACLWCSMQAGFLLLEVGFSRAKNAGAGVAKVLVNFSIASPGGPAASRSPSAGSATISSATTASSSTSASRSEAAKKPFRDVPICRRELMFFGFVFCAVSLAIVWGTTLERIKFGAYVIYAIVFGAVIYPLLAHCGLGRRPAGGHRRQAGMDFAGSSVVHLIGATGAFAALLLLGPRIGKYNADGKPRAIPGHSMPLVGLGVLILWSAGSGSTPARRSRRRRPSSPKSCSTPTSPPPPAWSPRSHHRLRRRSTSAWPATARSPGWSRSPPPPATSSTGRRRSSAASPA